MESVSGDITHETRKDLFRALVSASCDIPYEARATDCYGQWVLRVVILHTGQEVRFVTGIVICGL